MWRALPTRLVLLAGLLWGLLLGGSALADPLHRAPWTAFTEGHVTADGILSACCFDADSRWGMGDLKERSFMEAWNSEKFQALRSAHLRKDVKGTVCEECVAYA